MKINIIDKQGKSAPECTNCNHRFNTNYARNPYKEMCEIAFGKFKYCPNCGDKYQGCLIEGVDFNKSDKSKKRWLKTGIEIEE